jgi:hypothetical protein
MVHVLGMIFENIIDSFMLPLRTKLNRNLFKNILYEYYEQLIRELRTCKILPPN